MTTKKDLGLSSGLPPITQVALTELTSYQDGSIVSRTRIEHNGGSLTRFAFDTGQARSELTAPFNTVVQILEGEAELVIGG